MDEKFYLEFSEKYQIQSVLETNAYTQRFGLSLSEEDVAVLVKERKNTLIEQQRVEFSEGILKKLIFAFCDSPFVYQDNYIETIMGLQEIFYLYKNESMDEVTDDELISYMREAFDGVCLGSLEHLEDTCLEEFARNIRKQTQKFIGRYKQNEE